MYLTINLLIIVFNELFPSLNKIFNTTSNSFCFFYVKSGYSFSSSFPGVRLNYFTRSQTDSDEKESDPRNIMKQSFFQPSSSRIYLVIWKKAVVNYYGEGWDLFFLEKDESFREKLHLNTQYLEVNFGC